MKLSPELLAAIRAGDLNANRVAADALLEAGDARAQAVIDGVTRAMRPNPATRAEIEKRTPPREPVSALISLGALDCRFRNGFVDEVHLSEASISQLPAMLELEPIRALRVDVSTGVELAKMMSSEAFSVIRRLTVTNPEPMVRALSTALPELTDFIARTPLAYSPKLLSLLPALRSLYLTSPPSDEWLQVAHGPTVKWLSMPGAPLTREAIAMLATSSSAIEQLNLGVPRSGSSTAILRSTSLASLHTFCVGDSARRALEVVPPRAIALPALRQLRGAGRVTRQERAALVSKGIRLS